MQDKNKSFEEIKRSQDKLGEMEGFASLTNSAGKRQMFKKHGNKDFVWVIWSNLMN